jgi:thiopurine S-methyltransferase
MDKSYWDQKWADNDIAFHQQEYNPQLVKYFRFPVGKVFVPLCGKSKDLDYLLSQGHQVVGCELSSLACQAFFEETKRPFQKLKNQEFEIFVGDSIVLWCGDFFKLQASALKDVNLVYERGTVVAFPADFRKKYVEHLKSLLKKTGKSVIKLLLLSREYDQSKVAGPPFSVNEKEIQELYGDFFKIKKLEKAPDNIAERNKKFGNLPDVYQTVYGLSTS